MISIIKRIFLRWSSTSTNRPIINSEIFFSIPSSLVVREWRAAGENVKVDNARHDMIQSYSPTLNCAVALIDVIHEWINLKRCDGRLFLLISNMKRNSWKSANNLLPIWWVLSSEQSKPVKNAPCPTYNINRPM